MIVPLDNDEWDIIEKAGLDRYNFHRAVKAHQEQFYTNPSVREDVKWDIQGVIGEYAVHKLFAIPFRHDPKRVNNEYDVLLPGDLKTEVKYCSKRGYRFGIDERYSHHFHTWDIGILVWPSVSGDMHSNPDVVKYISHRQFWELHRKTDWGHGGKVCHVELADMPDIEVLIARFK